MQMLKPKHLKLTLTLFVLHFTLFISEAKAQILSPTAKISLITVSSGDELYSVFGHSAIAVTDYDRGIDRVYNYGTFDFKAGYFILKFLRGTLPYQLSVYGMYSMVEGSRQENRTVTEQVLNLSQSQKEKLFMLLETNYLPENRNYAYRFFYDNCSTRIRDMFKAACGDSLQYSDKSVAPTPKSYRDWMNDYLKQKDWARFGMNAAIGTPSDHVADAQQEMYLPNNLMAHCNTAKLGGGQFVKQTKVLFEAIPKPAEPFWYDIFGPESIFMIGGLFVVFYLNRKQQNKKIISYTFDKIFFGIVGFFGLFVFLLWVATNHGVTNYNQNLLWLMPLHLPVAFMLGKEKYRQRLSTYFYVCAVLVLGCLILSLVGQVWKQTTWIPKDATLLLVALVGRQAFLAKRLRFS
jgi:hypothetical protein